MFTWDRDTRGGWRCPRRRRVARQAAAEVADDDDRELVMADADTIPLDTVR